MKHKSKKKEKKNRSEKETINAEKRMKKIFNRIMY